MSTIASGIFYLMPPLAAVGHPAVPQPDASSAAAVATSPAEAGSRGSPTRSYIIVDVPAINRSHLKSLDEVIGEEVRRRISENPDGAAGIAGFTEGLGLTDDGMTPAAGDLDHAVIAAHEQRIALLKQRLDALRAGNVAAPILEDLRVRLSRAEAARRLAVARVAGDTPVRAGCGMDGDLACLPKAQAVASASSQRTGAAVTAGVVRAKPHAARVVTARADQRAGTGHLLTAGTKYDTTRLVRTAATSGATSGRLLHSSRLTVTARERNVAQRDSGDRSVAHSLARARRSLAVARSLLELRPEAAHRSHSEPIVEIVGLWRWPGSESWSLADYRAGIA